MSIFDSLLRLVDPIAYRKKQEERRQKRKVQPPGFDDGVELPDAPPGGAGVAAAPLTCRVCGYRGGPDHRFCPRCLAETMERRR
ncbi:MAG: hypothetical protein JWN44_5943 [Myxococcales bacterium]|nr:hypothetical protein [Myxococcales bacterium]